MEKESSDLLRLALLGMLTGGGAYGGLRLLSEAGKAAEPKTKKNPNELELTLPSSRMPKMASDEHSALNILLPMLASGGGMAGGFLGASKLYDLYRDRQIKKKEKGVEKEYMTALENARQKVGELSTPHIDEFLTGLLSKAGEAIEKQALWGVDMKPEGFMDTIANQGKHAIEGFSNTGIGSAALAAWLTAALGAGGATYAIANRMDSQKEKNKERMSLPSEVKLKLAD